MRIAALVYKPDVNPAPVLQEVVRRLQRRGVALAGAVQHDTGDCAMELELFPSGRRISISQHLGSGSTACRLDLAGLADAAVAIRSAIGACPALAVFNKFGVQEAAGRGLRDEIATAVLADMPVLTPVGERFLAQWSDFTGGESTHLPCSTDAALEWWEAISNAQAGSTN